MVKTWWGDNYYQHQKEGKDTSRDLKYSQRKNYRHRHPGRKGWRNRPPQEMKLKTELNKFNEGWKYIRTTKRLCHLPADMDIHLINLKSGWIQFSEGDKKLIRNVK